MSAANDEMARVAAALNDVAVLNWSSRPLAYVYDRRVGLDSALLNRRLKECARYVTRHGWGFGGWWVDVGNDALNARSRPAFTALLNCVSDADPSVPRVCLIHDWGRLSHSLEDVDLFTGQVLALGAWVETCSGETRTPNGRETRTGHLTDRPANP